MMARCISAARLLPDYPISSEPRFAAPTSALSISRTGCCRKSRPPHRGPCVPGPDATGQGDPGGDADRNPQHGAGRPDGPPRVAGGRPGRRADVGFASAAGSDSGDRKLPAKSEARYGRITVILKGPLLAAAWATASLAWSRSNVVALK